jgi:hypothetical protein
MSSGKSACSATLAGLLSLLIAVAATAAAGQESAGSAPSVRAAAARRQANTILVNGTPTVLTWARGLEEPADLDRYASLGLNTAYILVSGASQEALARASTLASEAERRRLMVVVGLAPAALRDVAGNELPVDPLSDAYGEAVREFVRAVAGAMDAHPRLIGWSVEAVVPQEVVWNDSGFQAYLQDWYASLAALNESWGTGFSDWTEIAGT